MLTEEQKIELEILMNECPIAELKLLLQKAIPRYISGEIIPKKWDHGLSIKEDKFVCNSRKACIIGAALIGEKADGLSISCKNLFNIDDITWITEGFDTKNSNSGIAIRDYVNKISKVIFNQDKTS